VTDPLASLVTDLTALWGDPRVKPPAEISGPRTVLIDGLVWARLHDGPRRAWAWFPDAANHHLMADRPDGRLVITMGGPGRRVVLESYDGTAPDEHVIREAARYAYRIEEPLAADPAVICQATADALPHQPAVTGGCTLCDTEYGLCTERCTDHPCEAISRFAVERSDGDQSFGWDGRHESCETHLAEVVSGMVDGDETVRAVVAIRWDQPDGADHKPEGER
jgi:hypothetical protein